MAELKDNLLGCLDKILGTRDTTGVALKEVYLVTRVWSGDRPGNGRPKDHLTRLLPTPGIENFSHDLRLLAAGEVKQGDIFLRMISKSRYPEESEINGASSERHVEKFYKVGEDLYKVISHVEHLLWWDVQLRKLSPQEANSGG